MPIQCIQSLQPSAVPTTSICSRCGSHLQPVPYARATELRVYRPEYHLLLSQELMLKAYQQEQLALFHRLLDYDRVCDWAKTTRRAIVGVANCKEGHPLKHYLDDIFPSHDIPDQGSWHARWRIFPTACEALKGYPHLPHHERLSFFTNMAIQSASVTFTMYAPLPSWTQRLMTHLRALPFDCKITREYFLTLLRSTSERR